MRGNSPRRTVSHDQHEAARQKVAAGIEVLLDDRNARPGFKFMDADLIGFPLRVTVDKRGLSEGVVELRKRRTGEVQKLPPDELVAAVSKLAQQMLKDEQTHVPVR